MIPDELRSELADAGLEPDRVVEHIQQALAEDLPPGTVDATSAATIPPDATARGDLNAREAGVVAGLGVAAAAFHLVLGDEVSVTDRVPDGTHVEAGAPEEGHAHRAAPARIEGVARVAGLHVDRGGRRGTRVLRPELDDAQRRPARDVGAAARHLEARPGREGQRTELAWLGGIGDVDGSQRQDARPGP